MIAAERESPCLSRDFRKALIDHVGGGVSWSDLEFRETHISHLAFVGERVYKFKKPVDLGFVDFRTLSQRRHFCEEEVRLNRRLAAPVYRGVVAITRDSQGRIRVDGGGEPIEFAVEMHRLPADGMLDQLLERGEVEPSLSGRLSRVLVEFHRTASSGPEVARHGTLEAVERVVLETVDRLLARNESGATARIWEGIRRADVRFLQDHGELLRRRHRERRVRDGHGDLHAQNVCVAGDQLFIYDCLEFSPSLRCCDVASDLAFLAMDLESRGAWDFARELVRAYRQDSGDRELDKVLGFYKVYRACVRALVAAIRVQSSSGEAAREAVGELRRYQRLAASSLLGPTLIVMCGLPGTGKSWISQRLSALLGAPILRSDLRRKQLVGIRPTDHTQSDRLYSKQMSTAVYADLCRQAKERLHQGQTVVVDAACTLASQREAFREIAQGTSARFLVVHCDASESVVKARLRDRRTDSEEPSDADFRVFQQLSREFEAPRELPAEMVVAVSESPDPAAVLDRILWQCLEQGELAYPPA